MSQKHENTCIKEHL